MIFVIAGVLISIYYCFYLHDKVVLEAIARETAMEASRSIIENRSVDTGEIDWQMYMDKALLWRLLGAPDKTDELEQRAQQNVQGELLAGTNASFDVKLSGTTVIVSYYASSKLAKFGFMENFPVVGAIAGEVQQKNIEPEEFIRLLRGIIKDKE